MQDQTVEKTFCTTRDAALLLGVSVGTVQTWVEGGRLEAWRTAGGHRRVLRDSVLKLLHQQPDAKATQAAVTKADVPAATPAKRRLQILAVDDTPLLLRLHHAKMASWALRPLINTCDNAIAALIQIGRKCPDLLVADLQMPGMDGFTMLRYLVDVPEVRDTTIVAVTALTPAEIEERGGLPSGIEVLPKPIPFDRLLEIAEGIAERKQLERRAG
jgi:excisionase family DNA binding protein